MKLRLKPPTLRHAARAVAVWGMAWSAMLALDGRVDLGSQALLLVLAAALAALWLPVALGIGVAACSVLLFNYAFVPPRGTLRVDLQQHALLLVTLLAVSTLVAWLVNRQRQLAARERLQHERTRQLRALGDALRDAENPLACVPVLRQALAELTAGSVALLLLRGPADASEAMPPPQADWVGDVTADERVALWLCLRESRMSAASGADHPAWYLPLRGSQISYGAALLRLPPAADVEEARAQAQALCDQMGQALQRAAALRAATEAREVSRAQALRNTLLAAIAHDHRTPLATILGAASSLRDQGDRLTPAQRERLAGAIVDEASQLARLTDNTLQLARLDTPGVTLRLDWESIEELIGSVLRRARNRHPDASLRSGVEPGVPLVRCDAVLLVQLLDNLVDNALVHGAGPVEVSAAVEAGHVRIQVSDSGPGVAPEWRARIFEAFERGPGPVAVDAARRGAGVGLAVCRAIARVHGGELGLREATEGGATFELRLPLATPPPAAPEAEATP